MKSAITMVVCFLFVVAAAIADEPVYKEQVLITPGWEARILTWQQGDATDRMIGRRNWAIVDPDGKNNYLFVACSIEELGVIKEKLFPNGFIGWAWKEAFKRGYIVSVWYSGAKTPFYALRADIFRKMQADIELVHRGRLPADIVR